MKETDIKKIKRALEKSLDEKRYEHTLGVAYTAASLAMRYCSAMGDSMEVFMENAYLAGLLHDCGKSIDREKRIAFCEKHNIMISDCEKKNPSLLHAKVGSFLAMDDFKVHDSDVINAILNHNTGRPGMSLLEKVVFVADYIEPGRNQAPNLAKIRKMAFMDLDEALLYILEDTLEYISKKEKEIDPMTQKTYEYYKEMWETEHNPGVADNMESEVE